MSGHTRIEQEIRETLQHYSGILQISPPKLDFSSNRSFGGQYYKGVVTLNKPIIDNWDKEHEICQFLIVHELVHVKYGETTSTGIMSLFIPSLSLISAFSELRANTLAYEITGSNDINLKHYFKNFYPYPIPSFIGYSGGYLKGHEYVDFILRHQKWTTQTIKNASSYFKDCSRWYRLVSKRKYLIIQQKFS